MLRAALVTWIGKYDLKAAEGIEGAGLGPIGQVVAERPFDEIHLVTNWSSNENKRYAGWLAARCAAKIYMHLTKLRSPTHYGDIYQQVAPILEKLKADGAELTYHLSPGTPAMQSIWVLLAKTTYPAQMIQSSPEAGVEDADIPFDIAAEYIPQFLQESGKRLTELAQGNADENAEFADIIHRSLVMRRVIEQAKRIALHPISVLIEGESGTGKELMARAIHRASPRSAKPFVSVNCGAIPPELVESEFFGHKKGAFTGAASDRKGHFEQADGGTLFLDEIGELPKAVQVKLLRALQQGVVTPVGTSEERKVDVRIVAATNRTLIEEVAADRFREDLFYRLAVAIIKLPPLRARSGDISLLIETLLQQINSTAQVLGIKHKKISASARNLMLQHAWPGNIRELLNTLQRAAVWSDEEVISAEAIKDAIQVSSRTIPGTDNILNQPMEPGIELETLMARVARHYIERALDHTHNNKTQAAKLLGFGNYQTLSNWMTRYGVKGQ
jgi:transcriptional regulator with PAS, ATPase and Fis domain